MRSPLTGPFRLPQPLSRPFTAAAAAAFALLLSAAPMAGSTPVTHARVFEVATSAPGVQEAVSAARAALRAEGVVAAAAMVRRWALAHTASTQALEPVAYAEPGIFATLGARALDGTPETALAQGMLVVSRSFAERFFGTDRAIGQVVVLNGLTPVAVGAVIDDTMADAGAGVPIFASLDLLATVERGTSGGALRAVTLIRMSGPVASGVIAAALDRAKACACAEPPAFLPATVKPLS